MDNTTIKAPVEGGLQMTREEWLKECHRLFELNDLPCSDALAEKLYLLTERMLEVNKSMNLTAIKDEKAVILRHYVDSLKISEHIPQNSTVIDVGCGAGFPSLPLALARPDLKITALDGTAKRIRYVSDTAKMLGAENLTAIAGRAEEYAMMPEYRERFDVVTARAVAALPVLCELCLPFARIGGQMIAMKSQQADEELAAARNCIQICGGSVTDTLLCSLTADGTETEERKLIFIQKQSHTPKNYPRHFSKISKKPL